MSRPNVAIVDGGGANIASLQFALARLGAKYELTSNGAKIRAASHVILPGVGAANAAMERFRDSNLVGLIPQLRQPLLGICLGMQILGQGSQEEDTECIGVFPGQARVLDASPESPVPNMGWCRIDRTADSALLDGIEDGSWFYFVHSYALPVGNQTIATATHTEQFSAVMARDNFFATQFHPERSSSAGARLLQNFLEMA